jgi:hypothetical protein
MTAAPSSVICRECAVLVPDDWPNDSVLDSRSLTPVDAARHLLVFTWILHGTVLSKRHVQCLLASRDWLNRIRTSARKVRIVGVERELFDLWLRFRSEAQAAVEQELDERQRRPAVELRDVRRALRAAMNSVGWDDFGFDIEPGSLRIRIAYPESQARARKARQTEFMRALTDRLGGDVVRALAIGFRKMD